MKNNLHTSSSLYLLQHANNPVHWQQWNENLLRENVSSNRLLIISIGYSSCHWCHVMEEESFEDEGVAERMNSQYVSIKIDREERPDLDTRYMNALQLMTGSGGWPLNIIALPDGTPIYGGTYFGKQQWLDLLQEIHELWTTQPKRAIEYGKQMQEGLTKMIEVSLSSPSSTFTKSDFEDVITFWMRTIDPVNGGPNGTPKFPMPSNYSFLLNYGILANDDKVLDHVFLSLERIALGGIYDFVGGGISRYSTDRFWKVPHFEKMLYDNAQIVSLFSKAYRTRENPELLKAVDHTLDFISRDLLLPNGLYASALDADSATPEGPRIEGGYYTWTLEELEALEITHRELFNLYFDINTSSAWEGVYVLHRKSSPKDFIATHGIEEHEFNSMLEQWGYELKKGHGARKVTHPLPLRDDKALTSWNALVVQSFSEAFLATGRQEYRKEALRLIQNMQKQCVHGTAILHQYAGKQEGFLEDYALFGTALLYGYALSGEEGFIQHARLCAENILTKFSKQDTPFLRMNADESEGWKELLEIEDDVIPSSNALAAQFFIQLSTYSGEHKWRAQGEQMVAQVHAKVFKNGPRFSHWLETALGLTFKHKEVVVIGPNAEMELPALTERSYVPNTLFLLSHTSGQLPLSLNRSVDQTTFFICENAKCNLPTRDVHVAKELWKK